MEWIDFLKALKIDNNPLYESFRPSNLVPVSHSEYINTVQNASGLKKGTVEGLVSYFSLTGKKIRKEGFPDW